VSDTQRCPHCGRVLVEMPAGHEAPCGRQVTWDDSPQVIYPMRYQIERIHLVQYCERMRARVA
jgi:hypothetical protein